MTRLLATVWQLPVIPAIHEPALLYHQLHPDMPDSSPRLRTTSLLNAPDSNSPQADPHTLYAQLVPHAIGMLGCVDSLQLTGTTTLTLCATGNAFCSRLCNSVYNRIQNTSFTSQQTVLLLSFQAQQVPQLHPAARRRPNLILSLPSAASLFHNSAATLTPSGNGGGGAGGNGVELQVTTPERSSARCSNCRSAPPSRTGGTLPAPKYG